MPRALKIWLSVGAVLLVVGVGWGIAFAIDPTKSYDASGPAMEPTLFDGDEFDVRLGSASEVRPGDVVVARSPLDGTNMVKRVVAVGRQSVRILGETCALEVDGALATREPVGCPDGPYATDPYNEGSERTCARERLPSGEGYVVLDSGQGCRPTAGVDVPEGYVFLLGDHRDRSNDSANPRIGPVPLRDVVGVVRLEN